MTDHTSLRKPAPQAAMAPKPKTPAPVVHHATASGGRTLDARTQREMGSRFGHDFSQVRIHTDAQASESAQFVGANAYAVGSDIVFGEGRYAPGTTDGTRLLAHELTHVVQQARQGPGDPSRVSRRGDASEQEAQRVAEEVLGGNAVDVTAAPTAAIAREGGDSDNPFENPYLKWGGKVMENIPGLGFLGGAIGTAGDTVGMMSGKSTGDQVLSGAKAATGVAGMAAELGGFEGIFGGAGLFGEGGGLISALTGGSLIGEGGALSVLGGAAAEGGISGVAGTILPSLFGGAEGAAALPGVAGMEAFGAEGALMGGGLEGAAALGPAAAVLGAGLGGAAFGNYLAHNTEVGGDSVDSIGGIDRLLTGEGQPSAMLRLDDYRQEQWDAGGLGYLKSAGAGVAEGGVALAGAVGGLAEGAYHGLGAIGSGIAGLFD